jgi:3'(2'), 5'-bisphosphate nucleotidase
MRQSIALPPLIAPLLALARAAGDAILSIYNAPERAAVTSKADSSPLTEADLAAHHLIVDGLRALTPDVPVVSEEGEHEDVARDGLFWLVDPLDGTKEFVDRNGDFTVNIALIDSGAPRLGVVHVPAHGCTYWGGAGLGAFRARGGEPVALRVAAPPSPGAVIHVVASKSHLNAETERFIARFEPRELVQAGSSLKFCRVAEGAADVYPRLAPTCEWDTAAAQAVLEGAGGHVVTLAGKPLRCGKADILNPHFVAVSSLALLQPVPG